ncbi:MULTISPECIES: hypothetical protein [Rhodopseudomonas]|uniref:Uncharacterized protein n=1 Tax=Rhodopseudomonas palustris TaxID=1076 RepID=A0A0D7EBG4_RHOPL|nr:MULTISPECIES: hypothetical protein [Rhodopseudomonas]KIZ38068.1 hypothetical protein OO17_23150 [Rhodopseudomonas palustris]MDF3810546.1 hypothetical protein [Rhodopseudomonas sp. BAL398]WOK18394.1 hypothetical protein RBJ75_02355 [Rhodopseudomonas sp. BAL398]
MARNNLNNARHLVSTIGTGDITFGSVPISWQGFAAAGAVDGDTIPYELREGDDWENGYLTIGGSVTTGTRNVVESSNGGSPLSLTGTAVISCVPLATSLDDDVVSFVRAQSADSTAKGIAQTNIGMTTVGKGLATATDAAAARSTLGVDTASTTKTGAYTIVAADYGAIIECSGTFTVGLTAAATLGDGFKTTVFNSGTGIVTLDPDASETIGLKTTIPLGPGSSVEIKCDGTKFSIIGGPVPIYGSWTGTVGAAAGAVGSASVFGNYTLTGNKVDWSAVVSIAAIGTASGFISFTLPPGLAPNSAYSGYGREGAVNGHTPSIQVAPSASFFQNYDGSFFGAAGYSVSMGGTYYI